MKPTFLRLAAVSACLLAAFSAQAKSLCAEPPTPIDRRACEAVRQGPQALNQFIQRMNWHRHSLSFFDYVDEATQMAWDEQRRALQAAAVASGPLR